VLLKPKPKNNETSLPYLLRFGTESAGADLTYEAEGLQAGALRYGTQRLVDEVSQYVVQIVGTKTDGMDLL
jgi:hypothetical protein